MLIKVGDEVSITIPKENRDWGYNPCPDGTIATVIGFSESIRGRVNNFGRKPGVYPNDSWVKLRMPDGSEHTEFSGRLRITGEGAHEKRLNEHHESIRAAREQERKHPDDTGLIRELPELPFWEWDIVSHMGESLKIVGIDYDRVNAKTNDGGAWPIYHVGGEGWYRSAKETDIHLIRRGQVWQFYHGFPIKFASVEEEANLHHAMGLTYEIRNPANKLYQWTKDEVLSAIARGLAHGFSVGQGLFGSGIHHSAMRFVDEELGKRVAGATLKGFGLA